MHETEGSDSHHRACAAHGIKHAACSHMQTPADTRVMLALLYGAIQPQYITKQSQGQIAK
jgi:hypothetical protein